MRKKQKDRSKRYKMFLKKVSNKSEGSEFYAPVIEDGQIQKRKRGWSNVRISGQRVAEFLDYGMTNPTEDDLRNILAAEERDERVCTKPVFFIHFAPQLIFNLKIFIFSLTWFALLIKNMQIR